MTTKTKENNVQIGFPGLLALIFITLKLTGYIDWSWFWVLSPLLIPLVLIFVFLFVAAALGADVKKK